MRRGGGNNPQKIHQITKKIVELVLRYERKGVQRESGERDDNRQMFRPKNEVIHIIRKFFLNFLLFDHVKH